MALTRLPSFTIDSTSSFTFANATITSNVLTGNLLTDNILHSNGVAYNFTTPAAGSTTQIQFNDAGSFGGNANLTFNKTTGLLTVTGNLVASNANLGNVANANYFSGNAFYLTNLLGTQVTGEVAYANRANSVAVANVVGIGNIATINKDGNASNILYGNGVFASAPVTYGNSNVATFLASFGSNTITTTGNITSGNANLGNLVTANFFSGNAFYLTNIVGTQVTGEVAFANKANSVAGANVTGQVGNALVAGTVYTSAQPNITSVGTLSDLSVSGNLTLGGNLTVNGTLTSINSTIVQIDDLALVLANDASTSSQANGAGIIINGASANMLYINSTNSFTFSHAISADGGLLSNIAVANITGIGNIATINKDGNASNILYGNGVFAAAPAAGSSYGNSNVATYLPTYTGNLSPGNLIISPSNLKISGGTSGYVLSTDGASNLSWVAQSGGSGGGASVTVSTTAPSTPSTGDMWLDSNSGELNVYFGGAWGSVSETAPQFVSTVNYFTGDSVSTTFTLTTTPAAKEYTLVAVGGVLQPRSTYDITGTSLVFSSAVPSNTPIEVTILGGTASPIGAAATVTAAAQANITSLGTLTGLTVAGDVGITGNLTVNGAKPATTGKAIAMAIVFGF